MDFQIKFNQKFEKIRSVNSQPVFVQIVFKIGVKIVNRTGGGERGGGI